MFFPYIKDIATQNITSIGIEKTMGEAIQLMIKTDHRAIIVDDGSIHYIILAQDILMANPSDLDLKKPLAQANLHRISKIDKNQNILEAVHLLHEPIDYILVMDNDKVFGLLSHRDLMNATDPEILMENYSIGDVIKSQKNDIWIGPDEKVINVISQMKRHNKDCATVIENGEPVGIFTVKDVLSLYKDHQSLNQPIASCMTQPVQTIEASFSIKQAIEFIKNKPFRRLVVVNAENKMMGMSMQKDLISLAYSHWSALMKKHQQELLELNNLLLEKADRYKQLAAIDPLTSLYNRYKFIQIFTTEIHAMTQREQFTSMLMLDIDYFKAINDNYGHNTGDQVLVEVAGLLKSMVRNIDVVSRWGGEEFIILLPTAQLEQATVIAEKMRQTLLEHKFEHGLKITASIGVHQVNAKDKLEETVAKADSALYEAKKRGRNRTEIYIERAN